MPLYTALMKVRAEWPAMRKLLLSLVLPLLMLLSQQGAVWHELEHLAGTPADKRQPADKLCDACLAFAHLATAAKPEVLPLQLARFGFAFAAADAVHAVASDAPARRSRGPPAVL